MVHNGVVSQLLVLPSHCNIDRKTLEFSTIGSLGSNDWRDDL